MDILSKGIMDSIRSRYATPTADSIAAASTKRKGVMAKTQERISSALDDITQDALAAVVGLSASTKSARTEVDLEEEARKSSEEAALLRMESEYTGVFDNEEGINGKPKRKTSDGIMAMPADGVQPSEGKDLEQGEALPAYIQEGSAFRTALAEQEAESYSTIFGDAEKRGGKFAGKDVTTMSMSEVFDFIKPGGAFNQYNKDTYGKNTTAIGKYQMVGATLRDLRDRGVLEKLGITEDTPFSRETQDKIAMYLAERRVKGKSLEAARKGMRNEWEGFKKLSNSELDTIINEIGR